MTRRSRGAPRRRSFATFQSSSTLHCSERSAESPSTTRSRTLRSRAAASSVSAAVVTRTPSKCSTGSSCGCRLTTRPLRRGTGVSSATAANRGCSMSVTRHQPRSSADVRWVYAAPGGSTSAHALSVSGVVPLTSAGQYSPWESRVQPISRVVPRKGSRGSRTGSRFRRTMSQAHADFAAEASRRRQSVDSRRNGQHLGSARNPRNCRHIAPPEASEPDFRGKCQQFPEGEAGGQASGPPPLESLAAADTWNLATRPGDLYLIMLQQCQPA